jgi:hypothetical protein
VERGGESTVGVNLRVMNGEKNAVSVVIDRQLGAESVVPCFHQEWRPRVVLNAIAVKCISSAIRHHCAK